MITFHGCASMEILSIGRISQTRKIAALCGKEGKIVMKKKKSEPYDVVMMLRILVLQRLYNLSDDQTE